MFVSHSIWPVVVVPHERVEGPKLHPSNTQLLSGVAFKSTDVRPHQRHPEKAELQHRWGGEQVQKVSLNLCDDLWSHQKRLKKTISDGLVERFLTF